MENRELNQSEESSEALHKFVAIGTQTKDLLKDAQLLGNNAEVVYSANDINDCLISLFRNIYASVDILLSFISKFITFFDVELVIFSAN